MWCFLVELRTLKSEIFPHHWIHNFFFFFHHSFGQGSLPILVTTPSFLIIIHFIYFSLHHRLRLISHSFSTNVSSKNSQFNSLNSLLKGNGSICYAALEIRCRGICWHLEMRSHHRCESRSQSQRLSCSPMKHLSLGDLQQTALKLVFTTVSREMSNLFPPH